MATGEEVESSLIHLFQHPCVINFIACSHAWAIMSPSFATWGLYSHPLFPGSSISHSIVSLQNYTPLYRCTTALAKSFFPSTILLWKSLPSNVKDSPSPSRFAKLIASLDLLCPSTLPSNNHHPSLDEFCLPVKKKTYNHWRFQRWARQGLVHPNWPN